MTKLCECGCGQPTNLTSRKNARKGREEGQPARFIKGHRLGWPVPGTPIEVRFWLKVDKSNVEGCWLWKGASNGRGYGVMVKGRQRTYFAHRVAWEITYGEIPAGLSVCHHCDNPSCVRVDHLFLGTQKDNMLDAWAKGHIAPPSLRPGFVNNNSKKTHCYKGHPLAGDNLYTSPNGRRTCRECGRAIKRKYADKKLAERRSKLVPVSALGVVEAGDDVQDALAVSDRPFEMIAELGDCEL